MKVKAFLAFERLKKATKLAELTESGNVIVGYM